MPITAFRPVSPLASGARVALVAPAGVLRGGDHQTDTNSDIGRAIANAKSFGWEPVVSENATARRAYLAGTDEQRLHDINAAINDKKIDGIWCIRGGYGSIRLLNALDDDAFARSPKPIIGFSDITALLYALGERSRAITYHGPTARYTFTSFTRDSFVRAVVEQKDSCGAAPGAEVLCSGGADGRLAGGNLAVLASLCGTPYQPNFKDCIVVLEDINEAVYRVDRLLQQLLLSGALTGCKAIIFGHCTSCAENDGRNVKDVLKEAAEYLKVPCMYGIPVGHIDDQWTLPVGALAAVDMSSRTLTVIR